MTKEEREQWREQSRKLREEFKEDLAKEFEVENNPKFEKCFELAWSFGHSSGLNEVKIYFADLVELIK